MKEDISLDNVKNTHYKGWRLVLVKVKFWDINLLPSLAPRRESAELH